MKPTLKQSLRGKARRFLAPLFLRDANATLGNSRAFGTSWNRRAPVILRAFIARQADPKAIIAYVPPIPKIAKIVAPGVFRRRAKNPVMKPCRAEVDTVLTASDNRKYVRLTNGQIVKATQGRCTEMKPALFTSIPNPAGLDVILREADLAQLPQQTLPRLAYL